MAPLNINIRPFLPSDFPAAATVVAAAMQDDELFVFLCPYRNANPESFRQYHLRSLQKRYYSGDQMIRVAEVESLDTISPNDAMERKTIVGLVIYSRRGVSDNVKLLMKKQSWLDCKLRTFLEQRLILVLHSVCQIIILSFISSWTASSFSGAPLCGLVSIGQERV